MTYYPKFFLNKGRILALWVMYGLLGGNWAIGNGHGRKKTFFWKSPLKVRQGKIL